MTRIYYFPAINQCIAFYKYHMENIKRPLNTFKHKYIEKQFLLATYSFTITWVYCKTFYFKKPQKYSMYIG